MTTGCKRCGGRGNCRTDRGPKAEPRLSPEYPCHCDAGLDWASRNGWAKEVNELRALRAMPIPELLIEYPVVRIRFKGAVQDVGLISKDEARAVQVDGDPWAGIAQSLDLVKASLSRIEPVEPPWGRISNVRFVIRISRGDVSKSFSSTDGETWAIQIGSYGVGIRSVELQVVSVSGPSEAS